MYQVLRITARAVGIFTDFRPTSILHRPLHILPSHKNITLPLHHVHTLLRLPVRKASHPTEHPNLPFPRLLIHFCDDILDLGMEVRHCLHGCRYHAQKFLAVRRRGSVEVHSRERGRHVLLDERRVPLVFVAQRGEHFASELFEGGRRSHDSDADVWCAQGCSRVRKMLSGRVYSVLQLWLLKSRCRLLKYSTHSSCIVSASLVGAAVGAVYRTCRGEPSRTADVRMCSCFLVCDRKPVRLPDAVRLGWFGLSDGSILCGQASHYPGMMCSRVDPRAFHRQEPRSGIAPSPRCREVGRQLRKWRKRNFTRWVVLIPLVLRK